MPGPHPAVAATRVAVRDALAALAETRGHGTDPPLLLVGVSGGADSMALMAAAAFAAPRQGYRVGAILVDHGLQPQSATAAERAAAVCRETGLDPVEILPVQVAGSGGYGPEAAAREARYAAFAHAVHRHDARHVLLGHTRDDQAEQVLLALARGSGTRALAGIPPQRAPYLRPFLRTGSGADPGITREVTRAACAAQGIEPWEDPHNHDPRFLRARLRAALPMLADALGDEGAGLARALARTADLARRDADLLDALAEEARARLGSAPYPAAELAALTDAVRVRVWRILALDAGAHPSALAAVHLEALDELVTRWRGQGPVDLPGGVRAWRHTGRIALGSGED